MLLCSPYIWFGRQMLGRQILEALTTAYGRWLNGWGSVRVLRNSFAEAEWSSPQALFMAIHIQGAILNSERHQVGQLGLWSIGRNIFILEGGKVALIDCGQVNSCQPAEQNRTVGTDCQVAQLLPWAATPSCRGNARGDDSTNIEYLLMDTGWYGYYMASMCGTVLPMVWPFVQF